MRITLKPIIVIQLKLAKTILVIGLLVKLLKSVTDVAGHVTSFDKKRKKQQNKTKYGTKNLNCCSYLSTKDKLRTNCEERFPLPRSRSPNIVC